MFHTLQVSPSDGKVLHFGKIEPSGKIEQVKGVTYNVEKFLGADFQKQTSETLRLNSRDTHDVLEKSETDGKSFYHIVLYLGPGDYHHFHSPTNWDVAIRRHFPGIYFAPPVYC